MGYKEEIYLKIPYAKPEIKKEEGMKFPLDIINSLEGKVVCRQCSSCHGCR